MSEPQENQQLKAVFKDPAMQAKAVDIFVRKKPQGWGRHSNAPYFSKQHGEIMRKVFDLMMKSRQDQVFEYEHFKQTLGISPNTLYLRVNQSIKWLIEMGDTPDKMYGRLLAMIRVRKEPGLGVCLRFRPEYRNVDVGDFKPRAVVAEDTGPVWKEQLQTWLEFADPEDGPFLREGLCLTTTEIEDYRKLLNSIPGVMANITSYSIKALKVNPS